MEFRSMLLGDMEAVPGYWIRWQTAICALVIVVPALAAAVVAARARAEPLRAFDLWAPCWAGMHPAWLLANRGLVSLVMLGLLSRMIGTILSAHGCWIYSKTPPILHDEEANRVKDTVEQNNPVTIPFTTKKNMNVVRLHRYCDLQAEGKRAGFLGYTMQLVYQIMSCIHSLNAVFLLIDTFLNNLLCGIPVDSSCLRYLSMALIHVPCYGLYWLIVRGKNSLCPKYFPNSFIKNALLEFARVVKAREQVVAGTLHHLTVEAIEGGEKKLYEAKVWVKPWLNFKQVEEFRHVGEQGKSGVNSQ
ncbi:hypothetical protein ZIOFF_013467 [Zingiber officinale]|uniref:Cysteine proteinase inhibitor n=1 Tax=Zingiber officinale TaxID=94328 RepID=A0A8J5HG34_ZINOF|nr:hypothetical protein ZIOFF_013467 [Zingiber officinale]